MVVPYPAGGSTDIVARLVAKHLGEVLKGTVVVDNKGGAAGAIGAADVARAAPDGYTLLSNIVTSAVLTPITQAKTLTYDPIGSFQPVAMVAKLPNVLIINKDIPVRNLKEFAAWARANPQRASYGTGGTGSVMHLTGELLKRDGDFAMEHVPYKGAAAAIQDLMGGSIVAVLDNITGVIGPIRAGQVRALGVSTDQRSPALPDVPTFAEAGVKGFSNASWFGALHARGHAARHRRPARKGHARSLRAARGGAHAHRTRGRARPHGRPGHGHLLESRIHLLETCHRRRRHPVELNHDHKGPS